MKTKNKCGRKKGYKRSLELNKHHSEVMKRKYKNKEIKPYWKGKRLSKEHKRKIGLKIKGNKRPDVTKKNLNPLTNPNKRVRDKYIRDNKKYRITLKGER